MSRQSPYVHSASANKLGKRKMSSTSWTMWRISPTFADLLMLISLARCARHGRCSNAIMGLPQRKYGGTSRPVCFGGGSPPALNGSATSASSCSVTGSHRLEVLQDESHIGSWLAL